MFLEVNLIGFRFPPLTYRGTPYSSYKIKAGKDGYEIEYKANDPAILESNKSLSLDKEKRGLFGNNTEVRREWSVINILQKEPGT